MQTFNFHFYLSYNNFASTKIDRDINLKFTFFIHFYFQVKEETDIIVFIIWEITTYSFFLFP